MKVPPVVLRTPETPVAEVWVTEVTAQAFEPTSAFVAQLAAALPEGVSVRRLPGDAARADRWVQDAFQAATVDGRPLVIRMPRAGPTQGLGLLSQGAGLPSGVGVLGTGTFSDSRFNYGGNVEVLSPHPRFTQGRLLVGDSVDPALGSWFEAQGVQTPAITVPTAWLASGHVDDVMLPLPSSPGRVRVFLASTKAGMRLANQAPAAPAPWRQRAFAEFNEACQRQLDAAEATVRAALAPTELDVVPLPVVFAPRVVDGQTLAVSALANPVNALVVGGTAIVGAPDVEPAPLAEAWRRAVEEALSAASLTVHWVDVASLTRHGGSVHCATEAVAAPQPRSGAD